MRDFEPCNLVEQPWNAQYCTGTYKKFGVTPCAAGWKVVKRLDGVAKDLVAGVWSSDTHKILIFGRNVSDDIPFPFAAVLATNKDIHDSRYCARIESQLCHRPDQNVLGGTLVSFHYDVGNVGQLFDIVLGPVDSNLFV
jgi:hypothetical protein